MGSDMMDLTGRVAVVTGGGRGIGREIARVLAGAGANVAIAELDAGTGEEAASEVRALGRESIAVQTDVRQPASVDSMAKTVIERLGKIDILVNNAGICINTPAENTKDDEWLLVIDLNLNGVFWCCRAVGQHMLERKAGSIVNIASMSGSIVNKPQPQAAYNASKAGVIHLTKSLAVEWAPNGIRVNSVSPGYTGTEMTKRGLSRKDWADAWLENTPMARIGTPNEVALAVWFLASDASSFTTGTDLIVDGGYTAL